MRTKEILVVISLIGSLLEVVLGAPISCPVIICEPPNTEGPVTYDMCWTSDDV